MGERAYFSEEWEVGDKVWYVNYDEKYDRHAVIGSEVDETGYDEQYGQMLCFPCSYPGIARVCTWVILNNTFKTQTEAHAEANRLQEYTVPPSENGGYFATPELWLRAVVKTDDGSVDGVFYKGEEKVTARGDTVIWGYFMRILPMSHGETKAILICM